MVKAHKHGTIHTAQNRCKTSSVVLQIKVQSLPTSWYVGTLSIPWEVQDCGTVHNGKDVDGALRIATQQRAGQTELAMLAIQKMHVC